MHWSNSEAIRKESAGAGISYDPGLLSKVIPAPVTVAQWLSAWLTGHRTNRSYHDSLAGKLEAFENAIYGARKVDLTVAYTNAEAHAVRALIMADTFITPGNPRDYWDDVAYSTYDWQWEQRNAMRYLADSLGVAEPWAT